jgi:hypothetical protein
VSLAEVLAAFGGSGGAVGLIVLALFITGHIVPRSALERAETDRDKWEKIAEMERQRADAAILTGTIVRDVMTGLRKELEK